MVILIWNVRGFNKRKRKREILAMSLKNKVEIMGLLETKVKSGKEKVMRDAFGEQ